MASSQICDRCTDKLIQSYIFIRNAQETWKMLNYQLDEFYNKTCYANNVSNTSDQLSVMYNVAIILDSKEISDNFVNSDSEGEMKAETNKQRYYKNKRKLKCVTCNIVLPSYKAWRVHDTMTHNKNFRCRICLQSYRTRQDLSTHYTMHLKPRCSICHRTVPDGQVLQHLKSHARSVHLCPTCHVAFYSPQALNTHSRDTHYRGDSRCVSCLQSLSREEVESHQCRFKCPECRESSDVCCIHHKYLMCYREQMLNLAARARCLDCDYVCASARALVAHVNLEHLNRRPYFCGSCRDEFHCKYEFKNHICNNIDKLVYTCRYCDKQFINQGMFQWHAITCDQLHRKFKCDYDNCSASFDSIKERTKHKKLRHGTDKLLCSLCDRVFLNDMKRKKHELQAHSIQQKRKSLSLDCFVCQTKFTTKAAFKLHLRYHRSETKYLCPVCNTNFYTMQQFRAHNRKHTLTLCEFCGVRVGKSLLKEHISTHSKVE